jgi:hypothetical protein
VPGSCRRLTCIAGFLAEPRRPANPARAHRVPLRPGYEPKTPAEAGGCELAGTEPLAPLGSPGDGGLAVTRDFLAIDDCSEGELAALLARAVALPGSWDQGNMPQTLAGVRVALIVDDTGWRNTAAFELGVKSMGGICVPVPVSLGGAEAIADLARYLDN